MGLFVTRYDKLRLNTKDVEIKIHDFEQWPKILITKIKIKLVYYIKMCIIIVHDYFILKAFQIPTMSLIMCEFNSWIS
jgi:hypothetical protein